MTHIIIIISAMYLLAHCIIALVMNNSYRAEIKASKLTEETLYRKMKHNMAHIAPIIAIAAGAALVIMINTLSLLVDYNSGVQSKDMIYVIHTTDLVYAMMSICVTWIIRHVQDEEGGIFKY